MLYMTPEEIEAFGPDSMPADATPIERARRAMPGAGWWEKGQQMGSRSAACRDTVPTAIIDFRDVEPRRGSATG